MAERHLLKFRNLDLTKDINNRLGFVLSGVFDGGDVVIVPGQLKIDIEAPWKLINEDGMVVIETATSYRLDTPDGQVTVIAVRAVYQDNSDPIVSVEAIEESSFNLLPNQNEYIIFAKVNVPLGATQVLSDYIEKTERAIVDKVGRNVLRGVATSSSALPSANNNVVGDIYVVADGISVPHIWGWDGTNWLILTDAATAISDLTSHRNNLFTDEKHLTDDEKDAMAGTSGTALSSSNRVVDNADTRIPTQDENNALQGSDGSPSTANRYVTEEFPLAVPEEKEITSAPPNPYIGLLSTEGPVYVGRLATTSANQHFKFYHRTLNREYVTSAGVPVNVDGVYLDSGLTAEIDPSIDPNVDADGFFSGASLYIKFDVAPDTDLRLLYGKRQTWGSYPVDGMLRRTLNDSQIASDIIDTVATIKGREWDDPTPTNEQNINLRRAAIETQAYLATVFESDYVAGSFDKMDNIPDIGDDFIPNVGIPPNYSFENTGLEGFNYTSTTATVTYNNPVAIGSVVPGQVFIDGKGDEYEITSIPSLQELVIQKRNGIIPLTINTTNTESKHGSVKPDNNPRKVNLASFDYIVGRERILTRELEAVLDEFHPRNSNVAYQIRSPLLSAFYREPRVRFYGGFQNIDSGMRARVVATSTGVIMLTGFFTDVHLLVDLKNASPSITVKIDGDPTGTVIDLSRSGNVASLGTDADIQHQQVIIANGLTDLIPHTIEIEIGNATDDFIVHGIDLFRLDTDNVAVLSGRSYVQTLLYKADSIITATSPRVATRGRGASAVYYINRSLAPQFTILQMTDMDGASAGPAGSAIPGSPNFTVTSGLIKFQNYRAGDIVKLITATDEEIKQISSIGPGVGQVIFTTNIVTSGAAILIHVASTIGDTIDPTREFNRYLISELGTRQDTDFSLLFFIPSDRIFTTEDGTTSISCSNVQYSTTGIDGVDVALECVDASSIIRIRAVATQLDLLVANNSAITADFELDGSPTYTVSIPNTGLTRITGWLNARYQSHELKITNAANIKLVGIILHEPTFPAVIEGSTISIQNVIADHDSSISADGDVIPAGCIAVDPFKMGGVYVNGTGVGNIWTNAIDFSLNPWWGRYLTTDKAGSYFEYTFLGSGFELEYFAKDNQGIAQIFLNGTLLTLANFPTGTFKGINTGAGTVDMYVASATPVRTKFGVSGIPYTFYTLRVFVQTPPQKNAASSAEYLNVGTLYEINDSGKLSLTPSRGFRGQAGIDDFVFGMDWARDERNFDSGAIAREEVPVFRTIIQETRAQSTALAASSTSIVIAFNTAFPDTDYSVTCTIINTVDAIPEMRPVLITNKTAAGFTVEWSDPLESSNYVLNYTAIKYS